MVVDIHKILSNAFSHSIALSLFSDENEHILPNSLLKFFDKKINLYRSSHESVSKRIVA